MDMLRGASALGLIVFLGAIGYNIGDKIDQRNIDYLITVGGIVLCLLVLVGGYVVYCMGRARMSARNMEEFGATGFGDAQPPMRRIGRNGPGYNAVYPALPDHGTAMGSHGWSQAAFDGPPRLTAQQDAQGSFAMDMPTYGGWGQQ